MILKSFAMGFDWLQKLSDHDVALFQVSAINCASISQYTLAVEGMNITLGANNNSYSLSDLDPYSNYTLTLTTVNSGGYETTITQTHTTRELGECGKMHSGKA